MFEFYNNKYTAKQLYITRFFLHSACITPNEHCNITPNPPPPPVRPNAFKIKCCKLYNMSIITIEIFH